MSENIPTASEPVIDSATMLRLYRTMEVIRHCEERLAKSHQQGLVPGPCHTYVGQEAIAAGVLSETISTDLVFSTHRGHGHALAKGLAPAELIAELYARSSGCSRGRGGSMHLFKPEIGLMGTSGIVGPSILQACGGGYAARLFDRNQIAIAFFGDGAVNNGAFHEGLNMAAIWNLPVLFVAENNQFATEVPFSYASGIPDIGRRGENYSIPGFELDGNDVLEVRRVAGKAIQRAREGGGPTLIECKTYRTRPHAEGMDDFGYRTKDDVATWKDRCPILRLRARILKHDPSLEVDLGEIQSEVRSLIEAAHETAIAANPPAAESVADFVFASPARNVPPAPEPGQRIASFVRGTLEALDEAMQRDPSIFVMGEGIGERGGNFMTTEGLYAKYGSTRLCDTPICERGFVGLSCGAAMSGARPVIDFMFVDFMNDAFGEVINQIAKMHYMSSGRLRMPIVLRGCGGIGHSVATHHSGLYHSIYSHVPGLRVVMPTTPYDAKGLFAHALLSDDPVLFLEHRELMASAGPVPEAFYEIQFGEARVLRDGDDVTVVGVSLMAQRALEAAAELETQGVSVEVVDPRTVSPLDIDSILRSVAKTGRLLVVDEAFQPCSVASEIAASIADVGFDELDAPIKRLSGASIPTPYAPELEEAVTIRSTEIIHAVHKLMAE